MDEPIVFDTPYLRRSPIYFLLESGDSMLGAPIRAVEQVIQLMQDLFMEMPSAIETVHISVITYSTYAKQIVPLTPLIDFKLPSLFADGSNNVGNALRVLADCIKNDRVVSTATRKGDSRPLVIWITAHEPTDDWMEGIRYLKETTKYFKCNIVAIKAGDSVDAATLKSITPFVVLLEELTPDQVRNIIQYLYGPGGI